MSLICVPLRAEKVRKSALNLTEQDFCGAMKFVRNRANILLSNIERIGNFKRSLYQTAVPMNFAKGLKPF